MIVFACQFVRWAQELLFHVGPLAFNTPALRPSLLSPLSVNFSPSLKDISLILSLSLSLSLSSEIDMYREAQCLSLLFSH
jgi:hypothetical protein